MKQSDGRIQRNSGVYPLAIFIIILKGHKNVQVFFGGMVQCHENFLGEREGQ